MCPHTVQSLNNLFFQHGCFSLGFNCFPYLSTALDRSRFGKARIALKCNFQMPFLLSWSQREKKKKKEEVVTGQLRFACV